jgi:indolepyruvate ferredoxin oxidoreductase beta subunit
MTTAHRPGPSSASSRIVDPHPRPAQHRAMGGEGGGVLADWIGRSGGARGWTAQTTSVPGVAQRTGATIYYVESSRVRGRRPLSRCWR